jgi:aspartate carbamoyltransferase catalytic subunit
MEILPMKPKSLIDINDYNKDDILRILNNAAKFKANPDRDFLKGIVCATLFFEPSTRTRLNSNQSPTRTRYRFLRYGNK